MEVEVGRLGDAGEGVEGMLVKIEFVHVPVRVWKGQCQSRVASLPCLLLRSVCVSLSVLTGVVSCLVVSVSPSGDDGPWSAPCLLLGRTSEAGLGLSRSASPVRSGREWARVRLSGGMAKQRKFGSVGEEGEEREAHEERRGIGFGGRAIVHQGQCFAWQMRAVRSFVRSFVLAVFWCFSWGGRQVQLSGCFGLHLHLAALATANCNNKPWKVQVQVYVQVLPSFPRVSTTACHLPFR